MVWEVAMSSLGEKPRQQDNESSRQVNQRGRGAAQSPIKTAIQVAIASSRILVPCCVECKFEYMNRT